MKNHYNYISIPLPVITLVGVKMNEKQAQKNSKACYYCYNFSTGIAIFGIRNVSTCCSHQPTQ